jgi:hypothetical protein
MRQLEVLSHTRTCTQDKGCTGFVSRMRQKRCRAREREREYVLCKGRKKEREKERNIYGTYKHLVDLPHLGGWPRAWRTTGGVLWIDGNPLSKQLLAGRKREERASTRLSAQSIIHLARLPLRVPVRARGLFQPYPTASAHGALGSVGAWWRNGRWGGELGSPNQADEGGK